MGIILKLVGVGDYTYKEKAKIKSKEMYKRKLKGAGRHEKNGKKNHKKRRIF